MHATNFRAHATNGNILINIHTIRLQVNYRVLCPLSDGQDSTSEGKQRAQLRRISHYAVEVVKRMAWHTERRRKIAYITRVWLHHSVVKGRGHQM